MSVDLAGAMVVGVDRKLDDEANDRLRHRCMDLIAAAKLQAPELNIQTEHVLHVVIQECASIMHLASPPLSSPFRDAADILLTCLAWLACLSYAPF